jgi:hypothetical protein
MREAERLNPNSQIPRSKYLPITQSSNTEFGYWRLELIWLLVFEISNNVGIAIKCNMR